MNLRKSPISMYFLSFVVTTVIFIAIFLAAYQVSYLNYQSLTKQNNILGEYVTELDILSNFSQCDSRLLYESSDILDSAGSKITLLEDRFGKNDKRVLEQKKIYTEIEYKHFNIVRRLNSLCENKFVTILFFYSNGKAEQDFSDRMGFIISSFKNQAPERVMVYSFDYGLNSSAIDKIKKDYAIDYVPVAIVNEKDLIKLSNIRELEVYLLEQ